MVRVAVDADVGGVRIAPVAFDDTIPEGMLRVYVDVPIDDEDSITFLFGLHKLFSSRRVPVAAVPPIDVIPPVAVLPRRRHDLLLVKGLAAAAAAWATMIHGDLDQDGVVHLARWAIVHASPVLATAHHAARLVS